MPLLLTGLQHGLYQPVFGALPVLLHKAVQIRQHALPGKDPVIHSRDGDNIRRLSGNHIQFQLFTGVLIASLPAEIIHCFHPVSGAFPVKPGHCRLQILCRHGHPKAHDGLVRSARRKDSQFQGIGLLSPANHINLIFPLSQKHNIRGQKPVGCQIQYLDLFLLLIPEFVKAIIPAVQPACACVG